MIKKLASFALVIALVCTIGGTSALAGDTTETDTNGKGAVTAPASTTSAKRELQREEKLRASVAMLVADTKAGKAKMSAASQFPPARSNSLSKNKKIAIGVGIAAVVVLVVVVLYAKNHLFDDFNLSNGH